MEERRLAAIMFSDITGYTAMMGKDVEKTISIVKKARAFQEEFIRQHGGQLIDEAGDAVLACFNSASDAVYCAVEIIREAKKDPELDLHIGIHLGEVIFSDDKLYGDGVNIAARIDTAARGGEICISEDVWKNIRNKSDLKTRMIGKRSFKNVSEPVCLYKIVTDDEPGQRPSGGFTTILGAVSPSGKKRVLFITALIVFTMASLLFIFRYNRIIFYNEPPEKSVAVLPFRNDTPDRSNEYICNGIMEQIILYLQKIEGFHVPSRTSIEAFRNTSEKLKNIASDLGVANILEGSVQKSGDSIMVYVRLVKAMNDRTLWQDSFDKGLSDIFEVQKDIAVQVAHALNASLSDTEKNKFNKRAPLSLSAYDYYLQGRDDHTSYTKGLGEAFLDKAIGFYRKAISVDSTYAEAYTGLALAYWHKHYWATYMSGNFLDSVKFLIEKALHFNDQLEEAYWLRSQYEYEIGDYNAAILDNDRALHINPNYTDAIWFKGILDIWYKKDFAGGLKILQGVVQYEHGAQLPSYLRNLGYIYFQLGLYDLSRKYNLDYARISGDSSKYYLYLTEEYLYTGRYDQAEGVLPSLYRMDSSHIDYWLESGWIYMMKKQYKKSLQAFGTYDSITAFPLNHLHRLGYLYWVTGNKTRAKEYFNDQIILCNENIKLNRWYATLFKEAYYDLAGIYFFTGDKEKGLEALEEFGNQQFIPPSMIETMKADPLFGSVRNTEEFKSIITRFTQRAEFEKSKVMQMLKDEGYLSDTNS